LEQQQQQQQQQHQQQHQQHQQVADGRIELVVVGVGIGHQARQAAASLLPPGRVSIVESTLQQL
jgi:D-arabinose 5-phosphate isomerase GutQ